MTQNQLAAPETADTMSRLPARDLHIGDEIVLTSPNVHALVVRRQISRHDIAVELWHRSDVEHTTIYLAHDEEIAISRRRDRAQP